MDSVSDRDFCVEFLAAGAIIGVHLSRLAEELVLWTSPAYGLVRLPDGLTTGSSIMPQKRNADAAELVRGKAGRVVGSLVSLLTVLKGLPMTYGKDMQEDKEPVFDAAETLMLSIPATVAMIAGLTVDKDKMRAMTAQGFLTATDLADWLVRAQGLPFREAHHVTGSLENYTELERAHLYSLLGAARIDIDDDNDGDYAHDFNMVMCVIADYQIDQGASDAPIIDILTHDGDGSWDNYCREFDDGGSYLPHELAALNAALTGDDIASNPQIQDILSQLGQVTLNFNETEGFNRGANVRKHARERVSSALGFIFTTPFVFAEGQ
jgi:hypothetical protein